MNNIANNAYREEKSFCYFHPRQLLLGVCPLCFNERLLLLAAKQGHHHRHHRSSSSKSSHRLQTSTDTKAPSSIHKIFGLGSLFNRHESHHWKSHNHDYDNDYDDVTPSPEESFITIQYEENGVASWEKSRVSKKVSLDKRNREKSVIENGKLRDVFRCRKRIGHMFQLIRWTKTVGVCHVEGQNVRKGGWMRSLTQRKTTIEYSLLINNITISSLCLRIFSINMLGSVCGKQ